MKGVSCVYQIFFVPLQRKGETAMRKIRTVIMTVALLIAAEGFGTPWVTKTPILIPFLPIYSVAKYEWLKA